MKKKLRKDYAALCNSSAVEGSSELLFGDLSKLAKDISEANKLTKKVRPSHSTNSRGDKYGGGQVMVQARETEDFTPTQREALWFFRQKPLLQKGKKKDGETGKRQWKCQRYVMKTWLSLKASSLVY